MPHPVATSAARLLLTLACLLLAAAPCPAGKNMIGRQSQNEGLFVLPAPATPTIDGDLKDWDFTGRIWVFADQAVRSRYSVQAAAMWDADALYLAAKWKDPTPAHSTVDPDFNINDGWKSDSWQMRVLTDQPLWITTWLFTPKNIPVMHLAYWKDPNNARAGQDVVVLRAAAGGTDLGRGAKMAYRVDDDGKGFAQEIRIPWELLYKQVPTIGPGLAFRLGCEFLWGDPTGNTWPVHRYADNMQPGVTSREFYWTATRAWGEAKLLAKGHVPLREYVSDEEKLAGTVPIRLTIPASAARFTVAINDAAGRRVRNLAGDFLPEDYAVGEEAGGRVVEVKWDCLDDQGNLAAPGEYQVVGLTHDGLGAEYEMCFYNPGTPPWPTRDGSGAWGADHCPPLRVARAGDWMAVSWAFAEGGSGILGVGPDGLKKWGEKRGGLLLAADAEYVYAVPAGWHLKKEVLIRLGAKDGSYRPFEIDGQARPFELPLTEIFGGEAPGKAVALAAGGGQIALALDGGKIALLDAASARPVKVLDAPAPSAVAFAPDGTLYAVLDGKPHRLDAGTGKATAVPTPGLGRAGAVAVDNDGNLAVADVGPDSQVKVYSPDGKLQYTCGRKGGRAVRGPFDPQAMMRVSSIAVDHKGCVWAVESWDYPRRVSVWGRDGKLVRDYVGNTGYAGTGCYLHDQDPNLAYVGPIELRLDKRARTWAVTQVLWVPREEAGEGLPIPTGSHVQPQRLTSSASGQAREYLYAHDPRDGSGFVVYMPRGGAWQPVAAVTVVGKISGDIDRSGVITEAPSGEFEGLNAYDGVFWSDGNGDGVAQRGECVIVPTKDPGEPNNPRKRGSAGLPLGDGWGGRIGSDLVFYANGIVRYAPVRFTDDGAPVYAPEGMSPLGVDDHGDLVPVPEEHLLLCLSWKGYARATRLVGIDTRDGQVLWSYPNPYPGVHGSHNATMPSPGLLIGPLKICGVAHVSEQVGRVFVMRGNLGQDFFMTTDGLYVGAMFEDGRLPGESLPPKEELLKGAPMEGFSHGGEPFNVWFGRQSDGRIRMTAGLPRQAAMILEVKGLETIRRLRGPAVRLDAAALAQAEQDNSLRAAAAAAPPRATVAKLPARPQIDGDPREWKAVAELPLERRGSPERGSARLAYDDRNLYVLFDVRDASPWRNEGKDPTRLFKTGDAVDVQLCVDPSLSKEPARRDVAAGDVRVVIANVGGKPAAVLMRPVDPAAGEDKKVHYHSPVIDKTFDRVEVLASAELAVRAEGQRYVVEAAIPLEALGLKPAAGMVLRGDVGFISSDADGRINTARTYWANKATNLVNDLPHEAWLWPHAWGEWVFE